MVLCVIGWTAFLPAWFWDVALPAIASRARRSVAPVRRLLAIIERAAASVRERAEAWAAGRPAPAERLPADVAPQPVAAEPASMTAPIESPAAAAEPEPQPVAEQAPEEDSEPRFSFYSMLPNFEVVIPEEEPDVTVDQQVQAIQAPGTYVLQAGSFTDPSDADRRRAELALLGIESRIQRISIDDRTYHRVRIGPMTDLDELNLIRSQLRQADIDVLRIRLGD